MKFFDRDKEIAFLRQVRKQSAHVAQFTVITGRRRIGKTSLVLKAYGEPEVIYFFVARKTEPELCQDFTQELETKLGLPVLATPDKFVTLFEYLMKLSHTRPLTLFIDEFQEFLRVNKSVYWDMQRIWDLNKDGAQMNLIVCGSVNTLMNRLFRDNKQPLYGRQTQFMKLGAFAPSVLKEILRIYQANYSSDDLLALYIFTGGVAKYVQQLIDNGVTTKDAMCRYMVEPASYFLPEGKAMLIEEFGKDYTTYFSILSLIARGHNMRADIENMLKVEVGGYLTRLETEYELIVKARPLLEKSLTKNVRYHLNDNFLIFWFRFIYKYGYMLEVGANKKLLDIIQRDYDTFSGLMLERYFRDEMIAEGRYTRIGGWWDRKGENEIDLIGMDELEHTIDFYEVKRQCKEYDEETLQCKAELFLSLHPEFRAYRSAIHGLTMEDM